MAKLQMRLLVHYGDGRDPVEVVAGQREMSDWERSPLGSSTTRVEDEKPITWMLFLAYSALRRRGQIKHDVSFDQWLDSGVEEIEPLGDDEDDDEAVDPTRPDQPPTA